MRTQKSRLSQCAFAPFVPWPLLAVLGTSLGVGIVVYQIGQSATGQGLARIEIGRSKFRYASSPSFLHSVLPSPKTLVIVEFPLYYNMSAVMGLSRFDSDDDDESNMRSFYMMDWKPEARPLWEAAGRFLVIIESLGEGITRLLFTQPGADTRGPEITGEVVYAWFFLFLALL